MPSRSFCIGQERAPTCLVALGVLVFVAVGSLLVMENSLATNIVLVAGALAGVLFLVRPVPTLLALFAMRAGIDLLWEVEDVFLGLNALQLFGTASAAGAGGLVLMRWQRAQRHELVVPIVALGAVFVITSVVSDSAEAAGRGIATIYGPFMLSLAVAVFFEGERDTRALLGVLLLGGLVPMTVNLWHAANGTGWVEESGYDRLLGGFKNTHTVGHLMSLLVSLGIFWFSEVEKRWQKGALILYTAAAGYLLVQTQVRTAFLALGAFVLVYLLFSRGRRVAPWVGLGLAVVVASQGAVLEDRFRDVAEFFTMDPTEGSVDNLGSGRIGIWMDTLTNFVHGPIHGLVLGWGFEGQMRATYTELDSHNDYIALLVQAGPIAVLLYVGCILYAIWRGLVLARSRTSSRWTRSVARYVVALGVAVLVANFFSNSYLARPAPASYWWGAVGALFALASGRSGPAPEQGEPGRVGDRL